MNAIEWRAWPLAHLRVQAGRAGPRTITGYAAVFGVEAEGLQFRESIARGAFTKTLRTADVRALLNHDANYILGRTKAGTLKLAEDSVGLAVEIRPPEAQWATDLLASMARGDLDQMSFGFRSVRERWEGAVRVLEEVELLDVSVVAFPAYAATSAQVRQRLAALAAAGLPGSRPAGRGLTLDEARRRLQLLEMKLRLEEAERWR